MRVIWKTGGLQHMRNFSKIGGNFLLVMLTAMMLALSHSTSIPRHTKKDRKDTPDCVFNDLACTSIAFGGRTEGVSFNTTSTQLPYTTSIPFHLSRIIFKGSHPVSFWSFSCSLQCIANTNYGWRCYLLRATLWGILILANASETVRCRCVLKWSLKTYRWC